jgi:hypothetical protein
LPIQYVLESALFGIPALLLPSQLHQSKRPKFLHRSLPAIHLVEFGLKCPSKPIRPEMASFCQLLSLMFRKCISNIESISDAPSSRQFFGFLQYSSVQFTAMRHASVCGGLPDLKIQKGSQSLSCHEGHWNCATELGAQFKGGDTYSGRGICSSATTFKCTVSKWRFPSVGCHPIAHEATIIVIVVLSLVVALGFATCICQRCCCRKKKESVGCDAQSQPPSSMSGSEGAGVDPPGHGPLKIFRKPTARSATIDRGLQDFL